MIHRLTASPRLLLLAALLAVALSPRAAVLETFFAALEQHTLQSDFTITVADDATQPINYPGTITMRGNCFLLSLFDTEAAYDGHTLYIYSASTDELTLSTPTEDELLDANPFLFAKALAASCTVTERPAKDPSQTIITLTPNDQSAGIQRFTLRLLLADGAYLPLSVEIREGKKTTSLSFRAPHYITTPPAFTLSYPDAFINDLR